jgi:hypothetical protein
VMMAILTDFSSLPFLHEPTNPDAFVFTFVLMLGVCICDMSFSNTRQWLMVLQHPEDLATFNEQPAPSLAIVANSETNRFGQPYSWTTQDTMVLSSTSRPIELHPESQDKPLSNKEFEEQFFVGGLFFGLPKKPVSATEDA